LSNNAIEKALWEIGTDPAQAASFRDDRAAFASRFRLDETERRALLEMDVAAMAQWDVNTMLLFRAFRVVYGPESVPDYMRRMNSVSTEG
jgi:hypothetical protein